MSIKYYKIILMEIPPYTMLPQAYRFRTDPAEPQAIMDLYKADGYDPGYAEEWREKNRECWTFGVEDSDSNLVAVGFMKKDPTDAYVYMTNVVVASQHRHQGIGSAIVSAAQTIAECEGYEFNLR